MKYAWIVVADSARARILTATSALSPLESMRDMVSPESRLHERDLVSDRPGRSFDSSGKGRHAIGFENSAKQQVAVRFAAEVSEILEKGRINNDYGRLVIIADPRFLGLLDKSLTPGVKKLVSKKISKDLSKMSEQEIRAALPERL